MYVPLNDPLGRSQGGVKWLCFLPLKVEMGRWNVGMLGKE